ncbi:hypothetical protein Bbelb_220340 [Branchiostoma belcheri]|nr:hypothetical protein Bbelb_220340 [Branchiostoma belcheri]
MSSTEEEPSEEAEGRGTDVSHKMASHENVSGECIYGYRDAKVSKDYEEESGSHSYKKPDGDVYKYEYKEPQDVSFAYKGKGCTSAENKSHKCQRPSLLRVIAIAIVVVTLLGVGACVLMYLTSMENKYGETANPSVKEYPNERMLESRMVSPALSKMTPAQARLATTLPDNTTGLPQMADTQPDQSTSLPGVISTDTTDISTNTGLIQKVTEGGWSFVRPPSVHGSPHVPRCQKGYRLLAGTCIKLVSTGWVGKSYYDAKKACKKEGATLAMPKTEELDVALRDLVKTEGGNAVHWIGMEEKKGTWYWVDGSKVGNNGYTGWNPGEPNYSRVLDKCGQYWSGRTGYAMWDDEACYIYRNRFICQRPPAYIF